MSELQPHEYALLGALVVAIISSVVTIFVAERYIKENRTKTRDDRLLAGSEKLLDAIEKATMGLIHSSTALIAAGAGKKLSPDPNETDINIAELIALQLIYAPHAEDEMKKVEAAYLKFDENYRPAMIAALRRDDDAIQRIENTRVMGHAFSKSLGDLQFTVVRKIKEKKIVFD